LTTTTGVVHPNEWESKAEGGVTGCGEPTMGVQRKSKSPPTALAKSPNDGMATAEKAPFVFAVAPTGGAAAATTPEGTALVTSALAESTVAVADDE
jgi:hypothetical protein